MFGIEEGNTPYPLQDTVRTTKSRHPAPGPVLALSETALQEYLLSKGPEGQSFLLSSQSWFNTG